MAVIGIESSAHTFGVGIVENGKVLSNSKAMFKISDRGIIPMEVADHHAENAGKVIADAIDAAGISAGDLEAVGYTKGPGIGPCLRAGQLAGKAVSSSYGIPLFPVNHGIAHIEIAKGMGKMGDPLVVYVSGGNSQILAMERKPFSHYHVYGETFDIGVGNMLDSFARAAKLNPAWGSTVEKEARGGRYIGMPYTVKGMDFAFSGLLTNAVKALGTNRRKDVAFSLQETAFSMICEAAERALLLTGKKEMLACGGVAQSSRLGEMLESVAGSHGIRFYRAPNEFNADNGAMIAMVAEKMLDSGMRREAPTIDQKFRIDRAEIGWEG
ncbi:MAG: tRNA (adenosine(37)-N6)-threonylcarbamoyltransferase complex transferase subunit TsaD [Candidatus Marsarchaeota archaeon]|jgi:glycoprotease/Kae1 family metallohydrolase|nr:tRNA (adenosine(37)-N6)-threonylcarbamoyltransferase complex transferase subunit TsaD [Candidatus Marsarchaeota archaeon]